MKRLVGDVRSTLTVREDLAVLGTLRAGVVVADGCSVAVRGDVRGTVALGQGSRLTVGGTVGAFVDGEGGTLSVAGVLATPVETVPGELVVAALSAVTVGGRTRLLTGDGTLASVLGLLEIPLPGAGAFRWDGAAGVFRPTATGEFRRLAALVWTGEGG